MRASDIMTTNIISVNVKDTVFDAAEMLLGAHVSAAPVVDEEGHVLGIVSEADLIHRAEIATGPRKSWLARLLETNTGAAREYVATHARKVADVMTRDVVTAPDDATLGELVALIEKHKVKRIPVVRDGLLVGIVSRANLLEALLSREPESTAANPVPRPDDKELRKAVVAAVADQRRRQRRRGPSLGLRRERGGAQGLSHRRRERPRRPSREEPPALGARHGGHGNLMSPGPL